jgi:hypothetical protein
VNELNAGLLTVLGVLAGLASLLVVLTALEPAHVRSSTTQRAVRATTDA